MLLLSTLKIKTLINQKGPQQQPTLLGTLHFFTSQRAFSY